MLKVSIITVVLNNEDVLADAITSVINQSYPNIEYIVVDGGSTDKSLDIINQFKHGIACFISEPDKGIYDAMNKGLALASGDVIGYLNADDVYASNQVIETMVSVLTNSNCQAVFSDLDYVARYNTSQIVRKWRSSGYKKNKFIYGWMPAHPTFFTYRSHYQELGGYNTVQQLAADYELMLRFLYKHGLSCQHHPDVWVKMRVGGMSNRSIKNRIKQNLENRKAWTMNGLTPKWYTLLLKPLSKIFQYFI